MDEQVRARLVEVAAEAIARARFEHHRFDDPPEGVLAEAVIDALRIEPVRLSWLPDDPMRDEYAADVDDAFLAGVFTVGVLSLPPQKETA